MYLRFYILCSVLGILYSLSMCNILLYWPNIPLCTMYTSFLSYIRHSCLDKKIRLLLLHNFHSWRNILVYIFRKPRFRAQMRIFNSFCLYTSRISLFAWIHIVRIQVYTQMRIQNTQYYGKRHTPPLDIIHIYNLIYLLINILWRTVHTCFYHIINN